MLAVLLSIYALGTIVEATSTTTGTKNDAWRIDGFESDQDSWYVQVDGVMGGKSSGALEFSGDDEGRPVMNFTGKISLDGGGFSSVRRRIDLDLSDYAGVVVTLEAATSSDSAPLGIELQFGDATSRYDFSSAFAIPLSNATTTITSVYLPLESFDRGTFFGFVCGDDCSFDPSEIESLSVYVLFQEGDFGVAIHSIEAVREPRAFPSLAIDVGAPQDIATLLRSTIVSGGGLYDKSYVELCIAIYWSVLNTLVASPEVPESAKVVLCAGLQRAEALQNEGIAERPKEAIAWALRYTIDAVLADLTESERSIAESWLPSQKESDSMEVMCVGRTSLARGIFYDGENNDVLDDYAIVGGNATFSVAEYSDREERASSASSAGRNSVPKKKVGSFLAWSLFVLAAIFA